MSNFFEEMKSWHKRMPELKRNYPIFRGDYRSDDPEETRDHAFYVEIARYCIYLYHKDSPLLMEEDLLEAKETAYEKAWKGTGEKDAILKDRLFTMQSSVASQMMMAIVKQNSSHKLSHYIALKEMYYQSLGIMVIEVTGDNLEGDRLVKATETKLKIADKIEVLRTQLESLEHEIFRSDKDAAKTVEKPVQRFLELNDALK